MPHVSRRAAASRSPVGQERLVEADVETPSSALCKGLGGLRARTTASSCGHWLIAGLLKGEMKVPVAVPGVGDDGRRICAGFRDRAP